MVLWESPNKTKLQILRFVLFTFYHLFSEGPSYLVLLLGLITYSSFLKAGRVGVGHVHIQDLEFQKLKSDVLNKTLFGPNLIPDLDMHIQQSKYLIQVVQKHAKVNYNIIIDTQVEKLVWKFKKKNPKH